MAHIKLIALFVCMVAAVSLASPLPGGYGGGHHKHVVIHVPYKIHTVHHYHKVPVYIKSEHYYHHEKPYHHEEPYHHGWD